MSLTLARWHPRRIARELVNEELIVVIDENRAAQPVAVEEGAGQRSECRRGRRGCRDLVSSTPLAGNEIGLWRLRIALDESTQRVEACG